MVTADNLNLDVLEMIFSHLPHQDLASTAVVSRSFFAGIIPRLYRDITYGLKHGKKYPRVASPFGVIVAHPWLAKYVKHIDIRFVPKIQTNFSQFHSKFLSECTQTVQVAQNLLTFKCTKPILPLFLLPLRGKRALEELRVNANITTTQSNLLSELPNLSRLSLDAGSWNAADMLPRWAPRLRSTLKHLTLYMSTEVNETVLEQLLPQLPRLVGLHIIGCPKVDHIVVMRLVSHVPQLESLSFSATESSKPFNSPPPYLNHLKHLSIDTRLSMIASPTPEVLSSILDHLRPSHPPLESFVMRLQDIKIIIGHSFIEQLVKDYAFTLAQVSFVECALEMESVIQLCHRCPHLERLELPIPLKELISFTAAVGRSSTIRTIVNSNRHTGHGPHQTLDARNVRYLMSNVRQLDKIISDKRIWMGKHVDNVLKVTFESSEQEPSGSYWFLPRPLD
ncbi:hypothetical protein E1B28_006425 [Marasmius oreades]|uniref:F-box domain-containing protein n=1 Tax=Marasmius oreades TaxID=181124 RepID=A0A9P7S594_9AGAR|nr:uncharacterized protein E1B28_006425 [Marasmius oreades]KAG7095711.1 hypothetical protein E1B28_006425 [Marasmius oreades]